MKQRLPIGYSFVIRHSSFVPCLRGCYHGSFWGEGFREEGIGKVIVEQDLYHEHLTRLPAVDEVVCPQRQLNSLDRMPLKEFIHLPELDTPLVDAPEFQFCRQPV